METMKTIEVKANKNIYVSDLREGGILILPFKVEQKIKIKGIFKETIHFIENDKKNWEDVNKVSHQSFENTVNFSDTCRCGSKIEVLIDSSSCCKKCNKEANLAEHCAIGFNCDEDDKIWDNEMKYDNEHDSGIIDYRV
jgi:hypothetical protein